MKIERGAVFHRQAILFSVVLFCVLFAIHATVLALIFSMLTAQLGAFASQWLFKLIGYILWAIPGYTAARIAKQGGLIQAFWVGLIEASFIAVLTILALSAEHTSLAKILLNALVTAGFVMLAAMLGGWVAHWRNASFRREAVRGH